MKLSTALLAVTAICMATTSSSAQTPPTIRPLDPGDGGVARWGRPAGGVPGPAPILETRRDPLEDLNRTRFADVANGHFVIYGANHHRLWLSGGLGELPNGATAALTWDSRLMLANVWTPPPGTQFLSWQFAAFRPEQISVDSEGRPQFPSDILSGITPSPLGSVMYSTPVLLGVDIDPFDPNATISQPTGMTFHRVPAIVPDPAYTGTQNPSLSPSGTQAVYHLQIYAQNSSVTWTVPTSGQPYWKENPDAQLGFLRVRVTVDNYREPTARVSNVTVVASWAGMSSAAGPIGGATFPIKEPTSTHDGRLVIAAPGDRLMFTYNSNPTSPNGWTPLRDLNHLYTDAHSSIPALQALQAYPLSGARFCGPDNTPIPQSTATSSTSDTDYFRGAYPWVTPDGDAIVFTMMDSPANALRAGLVYLGKQSNYRTYHIDGSLNPDRESSSRLVSAALSLSPGFWDVLREANAGLPMRPGKPNASRLAFVNVSDANYGEIDLSAFRDPDVIAFFPMNEELRHHPGPTSDPFYNENRWDHDPQATIDLREGRRGQLVRAMFPVEYHNPSWDSRPHVVNNNGILPPDIDYNAGFVGNAIFFKPASWVEVPHDPGLDWTGSFTLRCFFRADSLPTSGTTPVDLISMSGKYRLGVSFDRRVFGEVFFPGTGIGMVSLQTNPGTVAGKVWYHLALTYDQTGIARLWVDGAEIVSSPTPPAATASGSGQPLVIGPASSSGPSSEPWLLIDEVGIDKVAREGVFLWDAAYRPPQSASGVPPTAELKARVPAGLDPSAIFIPTGSVPWSAGLAELGEDLFFDPRLSINDSKSCASCHDPAKAFASPNPVDIGVALPALRRHTPTLVNRAFSALQFWDGHASSLEDQAIRPITTPNELGFTPATLQTFLNKIQNIPGYAAEFQLVFGGSGSPVTQARVEAALAAFQRSLFSGASSFDLDQMTTAAVRGEQLFRGKARCSSCHSGFNFTDELFHNTGSDHSPNDAGRAEVTGYALDHGAFKTPTVRDTMRRQGSLFHDGLHDIDEVLEFYNQGGVHQHHLGGTPDGLVDPDMVPLHLTLNDKADLKEFLQALDGAPIVVANPPDPFEPNDLPNVGSLLNVGESFQLDLTVRDLDFFTLDGPATVTISFTNAAGNLDLFALTPALQLVAQSVSTTSDIEKVTIPSGTHIICVTSLVGATNTYDLTVDP